MATREDLHRRVDELSEPQIERARIVVVDEVGEDTSVEAILARHGERRLSPDKFEGFYEEAMAEDLARLSQRGVEALAGRTSRSERE